MSYFIYKQPKPYIFIHIPKTAGKSLVNALSKKYEVELITNKYAQTENYHSTIHHVREQLDTSNFYSFTIVRNPYDRLCSYFFYRKRKIEAGQIHAKQEQDDMNKGILYWFDKYKDKQWEGTWFGCYNNQVEWIDETVQVVKFEDLKQINTMPLFADVEIVKTKYNKSDNRNHHYRDIINSKMRKRISRMFEKDFETFKYQW